MTKLPVSIKWSNAIIGHGKKLAGILTDIDTEGVLVLEDDEGRVHRIFKETC